MRDLGEASPHLIDKSKCEQGADCYLLPILLQIQKELALWWSQHYRLENKMISFFFLPISNRQREKQKGLKSLVAQLNPTLFLDFLLHILSHHLST